MKTLNHYTVEITLKTGLLSSKKVGHKYNFKTIKVLAENDMRYCLDDPRFITVEKKRSNYFCSIGKHNISSYANDKIWGTSISYNLYTDKKKRKTTIAAEITQYINKKYGGFADLDLSFLEK